VSPQTTPTRLNLVKTDRLEVDFADGKKCVFPLSLLRSRCPCAQCKQMRDEQSMRKSALNILPGNYTGNIEALGAHLVGGYAIQIDWSDGHGSGIYSFDYLRELSG
jgi:DUF971 family protein